MTKQRSSCKAFGMALEGKAVARHEELKLQESAKDADSQWPCIPSGKIKHETPPGGSAVQSGARGSSVRRTVRPKASPDLSDSALDSSDEPRKRLTCQEKGTAEASQIRKQGSQRMREKLTAELLSSHMF